MRRDGRLNAKAPPRHHGWVAGGPVGVSTATLRGVLESSRRSDWLQMPVATVCSYRRFYPPLAVPACDSRSQIDNDNMAMLARIHNRHA